MGNSDRDTINHAIAELDFTLAAVPSAISALLSIPAPKGDAAIVQQASDGFKQAASQVDTVAWDLANTASHQLPEVWIGKAADSAAEVIVASANDLGNAATVFSKAAAILLNLSQGFADAHKKFDAAQDPLHQAAAACEGGEYGTARSFGNAGATQLLAAIDAAETAATEARTRLTDLTAEARAHAMKTGNLDAADKLVLTEAAIPSGRHADNEILSESDAQRAAQRLDQLSAEDRRKMDDLLAAAKSPQERAYLMKTLAAGHSLAEVTQFDALIHDHGGDPDWLQNKLTPIVDQTTAASVEYWDGTYDSQGKRNTGSWTQGTYPTCVASSTVMARAMIDPSYALGLTTGNKPDDPASTSKDAFLTRLRAEQAAVYDHGKEGHQMLVIGHDGDRLEVCNPWGITSWISEDQFVNGHVGDMPGADNRTPQGVPPTVDGLLLPRPS